MPSLLDGPNTRSTSAFASIINTSEETIPTAAPTSIVRIVKIVTV